jgi:hypothetical protein
LGKATSRIGLLDWAIFQQLGYFCRIIDRIAQEWQYLGTQIYNIFAIIICFKTWLVFWHHLVWQLFWLLLKKFSDFCSISSGQPGKDAGKTTYILSARFRFFANLS